MRRRRQKRYISAVIRPKYEEVEEVTQEQFDKMMEDWMGRQAAKSPEAQWQRDGLKRVVEAGVTDGSRPMALCTRLEAALMAHNAAK